MCTRVLYLMCLMDDLTVLYNVLHVKGCVAEITDL